MKTSVLSRINIPGIVVIVGVILIWQISTATVLQYEFLPSPAGIVEAFGDMLAGGGLLGAIGHTLWVTLVASVVAISAGVVLGASIALIPVVRTYTLASVDVLRSLPVVALMPVAQLIWGPQSGTEVIVAVFSALWPITINTMGGVAQIHPRLVEVARSFRLSPADTFRKILFPAALPSIVVGARLAVVHALIVAITAEMLINPEGIGGRIYRTQVALQPEQMWVWVIISGFIGYLLNHAMISASKRALPGMARTIGGTS